MFCESCHRIMVLALLVLALTSGSLSPCLAHPSDTKTSDQYSVQLSEATVLTKPTKAALSKANGPSSANKGTQTHLQDKMQVGCEHGIVPDQISPKFSKQNSNKKEIKKHDLKKTKNNLVRRRKRSYYPWPVATIQEPQFQSISVWHPQLYPLQRPYYVPIYGVSGRIPLYFPPQVIGLGDKPYQGPKYLPPVGPTYLPPTESTTMTITNKFGDDFDDGPIWDVSGEGQGNQGGGQGYPSTVRPVPKGDGNNVIPTRRPKIPGQRTTRPPLVHNNQSPNNINQLSGGSDEKEYPSTQAPPKSTTIRTFPSGPSPQPPKESSTEAPIAGPSRCVWAIVSCCSVTSNRVRYSCFENLGCTGAFWDASPCDSDFAQAAISDAMNYYNQNNK